MAKDHGPSVKDYKQYEGVRKEVSRGFEAIAVVITVVTLGQLPSDPASRRRAGPHPRKQWSRHGAAAGLLMTVTGTIGGFASPPGPAPTGSFC
jgi:hypothetical protein